MYTEMHSDNPITEMLIVDTKNYSEPHNVILDSALEPNAESIREYPSDEDEVNDYAVVVAGDDAQTKKGRKNRKSGCKAITASKPAKVKLTFKTNRLHYTPTSHYRKEFYKSAQKDKTEETSARCRYFGSARGAYRYYCTLNALHKKAIVEDAICQAGTSEKILTAEAETKDISDFSSVAQKVTENIVSRVSARPKEYRGGYNPAHDAQIAETKYRFRQRSVVILTLFSLVSFINGVFIQPKLSSYTLFICSLIPLIAYLSYLRHTVSEEKAIRETRKQRYATIQAESRQYHAQYQQHRNGLEIVAIDDEDPIFEQLTEYLVDEDNFFKLCDSELYGSGIREPVSCRTKVAG